MEIENIEQWVGRSVVDVDDESVGKLEEVYFRADDAVLAEVKPGVLARKRLIVPLAGASVSRDFVRLGMKSDALMQEASGGSGFTAEDLDAVAGHYGDDHRYQCDELESSDTRRRALEERDAARQRVAELEAETARAADHVETARQRVHDAQVDLEKAETHERETTGTVAQARRDAGITEDVR